MQITIDTEKPLSAFEKDVLRMYLGDTLASTTTAEKLSAGTETPQEPEKSETAQEEPEDLLDQAVARATELLRDGQSTLVKSALADAGVKKVTALDSDDKIRKFMEALS